MGKFIRQKPQQQNQQITEEEYYNYRLSESSKSSTSISESKDDDNKRISITAPYNEPIIYDNIYDHDNKNATVLGMGYGYPLYVYKRFVGTLRRTGFQGRIIIGIMSSTTEKENIDNISNNKNNEKENENKNDNDSSILVAYLKSQNVTIKILKTTPCTYYGDVKRNYGENVCLHPYSY